MKGPLERAKLIRQGKIDAELPDYEELTGWLQRVPQTWLPGLLAATVHQCVFREVFQDGRLVGLVQVAEERAKDPMSILRTEATAEVEGPPEEIGTGLYRLADGQVSENEPEDLSNY